LAVELAKSVRPVAISPWLFCNRRGECYFDEESCRACKWDTMWRNFMTPVLEETKVKEHFTEHDLRAKCASDAESRAKCASDAESHAQALLAHADGEVTQPITVENRSA
jgi:integrase